MKVEEWLNNSELPMTIFNKKYKNKEETLDEFFERVSNSYAPIKKLIQEKKFIFGGRILASRGITDRKITYSNCYVVTPPEDNIESIFECTSKLARTYSYGGGCGVDLSNLRPNGAPVHNAAKTTCGPVGFMDLFSQTTETIGQAGRRGALMISLDINHPDVEEFIDCKTNLSKVNYANISVRVSNTFMEAVERKSKRYVLSWPCDKYEAGIDTSSWEYGKLYEVNGVYYKIVDPVSLFNKLVKNNWDYAEPGILYWDRIQGYNLLDNTDFKYAGTNPCRLKCRA